MLGEDLEGYWKLLASNDVRRRIMADIQLSAEQEAEAARIAEIIKQKVNDEVFRMARLLASKPDAELLGKTEYEIRDRVHQIGACALETALEERKKGGTKVRASRARTARKQPGS
jgi:hypothetical protein